MRTDDLIAALAADGAPPKPLAARALTALAPAALFVALAFVATIGPRHDLTAAPVMAATALKLTLTLLLAAGGLASALRLSRPGATLGAALLPFLLLAASLAGWIGVEFARLGPQGWTQRLVGSNASHCLTLIPLFALAPLAALIAALRHGAPTRPALAGGAVGLASAGVGACFYALNCTDDSPLFVLVWYSLASALAAGLGALIASRALRW